MLFRSRKNWVVDFFVSRGWLVKQHRLRRRANNWNLHSSVAAECLEDRTLLSTITVTSLADSLNAGSGVTLRDAIQSANSDASVDGSVAGVAGVQNVIVFQPRLNGTIALNVALGQMTISSSMKIEGLGARSTVIDAQHNSRIFNITSGAGDVTLEGLALENGTTAAASEYGGAIRSLSTGTLTVTNSTLSGNSSGAQGGAIYSHSALTVTNSILSGNSTVANFGFGGAIDASGVLTVTNSTLSGNSTTGTFGNGGAIHTSAVLTVTNSTIVNNHATAGRGGGIDDEGGSAAITSRNTIWAQNTDNGIGPDLFIGNTGTVAITNSLIGENTGTGLAAAPVGSPDAHGNLIGTGAAKIDPKVGPPADNGGQTPTMALLFGSPAIDAGSSVEAIDPNTSIALANDQRGTPFQRIFGAAVDMGAFESQSISLIVTSANDQLDATFDPANLTLRDAIFLANASSGANTIAFSPALNGTPLKLTLGDLIINTTLAITGNGAKNTTIDAQHNSRVFDITQGAGNVTFDGLTISGGTTSALHAPGAGIRTDSTGGLLIENSVVTGNKAAGPGSPGGGIYTKFGALTVLNSTVSGNAVVADHVDGGGIYTLNGNVSVTNSTLSGNSIGGYYGDGGAIYAMNGNVTLTNSSVTQNTTGHLQSDAGGIKTVRGSLTLLNSIVSGNTVPFGQSDSTQDIAFVNYIGSAMFTASHSLIGVNTGTPLAPAPVGSPDAKGNLVGTFSSPLDAHFGPLVDNGGQTQTCALLSGSPAINAGLDSLAVAPDSTPLTTDQRGTGLARLQGTVDMGAYEFQFLAVPTVNFLTINNHLPVLTGTDDQLKTSVLQVSVHNTTYTLGDLHLTNDGAGHWTLATTASIPDGTYNVLVHTIDAAGNAVNDTTTNELTVDTVAPATPTVNSLVTNNSKPVLTGTWDLGTPGGATVLQVTVNGSMFTLGTNSQLTSDGAGHWMLATTTSIPDGTYNVLVHTADAADNVANDTTTNELVVDTVAPATPTVNSLVTDNSKPVLTGTWDLATPGGATVLQVTVNGSMFTLGTNSQLTSDGAGHWTLATTTSIPDGTYNVLVHTADAAENVANDTTTNELVVDTVAPATPTVNSLVTDNSKPVLTGTWDLATPGGATVLQVTVNGSMFMLGTNSQLTSDGAGHWTLATTTSIPDGTYNVLVHTADAAGNVANDTTTNELVVDTVAPATPTVNWLVTDNSKPVLTGNWDEGTPGGATMLWVSVNNTTYTLGDSHLSSDGSGHWTLITSVTISDGTYNVLAHSVDAAGNAADDTTTNELIINSVVPNTTSFTGEYAASTTGGNTLTLASITQSGDQLTLKGATTTTATVVTSPVQLTAGGVMVATYQNSSFTFSSGTFAGQVWTELDLPSDFTNPAGARVHILHIANTLIFSDRNGKLSPGTWINPTQLSGYGETVTIGSGQSSGELLWADGTIWSEVVLITGTNNGSGTTTIQAVPSKVLVTDYLTGSGKTVHTLQTGTTNIVFVDSIGSMVLGNYSNPNTNVPQATAPNYPGYIASIVGNKITWTDGNPADTVVWTQTTAPASTITVTDYTNQNGVPVHVVQNGTNTFVIVDGLGNTSLGHFLTATTGIAESYPTDVATFSSDKVLWQDGVFVWTNTNKPPLLITFTDANNAISHVKPLTAMTLVGLDGSLKGIQGTRLNGKIYWSNGQVWDNLDFNVLNAFFEMGTGFP